MLVFFLFVGHLVDAATLQVQVSPVQKVIELLDELKGKVKSELAADEALMEEHTKWCDSQKNEREDAIAMAERDIEDLKATIVDSKAAVSTFQSEIEELAGKLGKADGELKDATKIRDGERSEFEANEKELSETVDMLERALVVIKRAIPAFLQGKDAKNEKEADSMKILSATLSHIVEAAWIDSATKEKVQAMMQSEDGDEDADLSLQPQATVVAYESHGGGILDTLGELQEKAETALSKARKEEMEQEHAFQMLKMSLEHEIKTMQKRLDECQAGKASSEEQQHAAEEDLAETTKSLAADKEYLSELGVSCSAAEKEFAERQKQAAEEMAAVDKAKEILESGVKVFLQVSPKEATRNAARQRVSNLLRNLAQKDGVFAFSQLATQALQDPFSKVRGMIEAMIERLLAEAGEEADAKAFCDTEIDKSRQKQTDLTARLDMVQVRIEKAAAGKAKLQSAVKELDAEVAKIDMGTAEAIALRTKQHDDYVKTSTEYKQSADAVANAIQVLQDYYAQGAFAQVKRQIPGPDFGAAKTDIGTTIISMLEVAEADFTRLLAEAETAEKAALAAFEKLSHENAVAKSAKTAESKAKTSEAKSLELSLLNYKEDHAASSKELDAVHAYFEKLKPQCETKVMTYGERKARREQEIDGLKEALSILEAAS
jgi:chromosome segregation ATPase